MSGYDQNDQTSPYGQQPGHGSYGAGPGGQSPGAAMPSGKGFLGALFDLSFSHFITPMVVKVVYALGLVVMGLTFLVWLILGFSQDAVLGIAVLLLGPILMFLYLCLFRMTLEFYVAIVRMSEDIHQRLPRP